MEVCAALQHLKLLQCFVLLLQSQQRPDANDGAAADARLVLPGHLCVVQGALVLAHVKEAGGQHAGVLATCEGR